MRSLAAMSGGIAPGSGRTRHNSGERRKGSLPTGVLEDETAPSQPECAGTRGFVQQREDGLRQCFVAVRDGEMLAIARGNAGSRTS